MRLCASVLAIAVLSPLSALAQEAPPPAAPAPAPAAEPAPAAAPAVVAAPAPAPVVAAAPAASWKDLITVEGLVDSYYMYNLTGSTSLTPATNRQFDFFSNSFTLNYAKVGLGMATDKAGFRLDLGYGVTGAVVNSAVPPGEPATGPTAPTAFLVQQAYATLTPISGLSIDFGKFVTTAGAEVIESNKNWLYSRSFLFFNIPLLHNGVRAGYKINDMVSAQVSVVNGWNGQGINSDINAAKTFGASATLTLPQSLTVIPTVYVGTEFPGGNTRILFDLVAAYSAGPLGLNLNFDFLKDDSAAPPIDPFWGVSAMGHYAISDALNATLRGEYAQTKSAGATTKFWEITAGLSLPFSGHYELRPEIRYDGSDQMLFNPPAFDKKSQVTALLAAMAYF